MKKLLVLLMCMSLFLCGCSALTDGGSSAVKETFPEYYADEETRVRYENESEFLDSDFCDEMKQNGYTIYQLSYDEERYELLGMLSDRNLYKYQLTDKETGAEVDYSICYNVGYLEHPSDAFANADDTSKDVSTTVEKDGQGYDVYISRTPYVEEDEYGIVYLPFEDYKVSIYADAPTPEDALAYIHDFDLVPAEETVEQPTETPSASSGEELAYHVDADNTTFYTSEEEFFSSEFCQTMRDSGFVPYRLSYDTEQYQFFNIRSDAKFYNYNLNDRETGERLSVTITYDTYRKNVSEFGDNVRIPMETTITTAVKDDVEYDVYVYRDPYGTEPEYSLRCLPIEDYEFTISSKCATEEEIIALFQQLDLVPATE